jgi:hypothetical protein
VNEVGQEFGLPRNSVYLFDLHAFPPAHSPALLAAFLRTMLHDAARVPAAAKAYVSVPADDTMLRDAVEQMGFGYEGSLFEQVRLGRARRWSCVPDVRSDYQGA